MSEARRNIPSFTTVTSTFRSYILSLPLLTTTISCIVIVFYAFGALLFNDNPIYNALSLKPEKFFEGQVWRILTYPYTHSYLAHLLFNILVFLPLSTAIEHTIGTLEYSYVLITIFTVLSGSIYLLSSLIFSLKGVEMGGLNTWIFGVVVWESRELAGSEREIFGLFRVPSHFYPLVLFLLMEIILQHEWFVGYLCGLFVGYFYSFGYLTRILPSSDFFSNIESKPSLSHLVNIRGFIKAEVGRRGGWWLPLWNDDSIEDPLETSINHTSNAGEQNQTDTIQVARSSSPDPHSTPVFIVPSSNTTRSNSPALESVPLTTDPTTADPNSKEKD
ncbi:7636_t:CDS:2 [Dentiscutata erythropus]|uniref:7636_t:CDS:1 n=1 Tax=Dentiscutata erythropus TaxID=1348616 RepID=A0A9N8VM27_9GLOM|nr:7636_t:CDS:2 [Dentiscutata erythropus]